MKKHILTICLIGILATASLFPGQDTHTNFRKAIWGTRQKEVLKLEGKKAIEKDKSDDGLDFLKFRGKQGGYDCLYVYYFADNKLVAGRYVFMDEHTNKNSYIKDFESVKALLMQKYGGPVKDVVIWKDDLYKDDPFYWGMAVAAGHLIYQTQWKTEDTMILLDLACDNFVIILQLLYTSTLPDHVELINKAKERAKIDIW